MSTEQMESLEADDLIHARVDLTGMLCDFEVAAKALALLEYSYAAGYVPTSEVKKLAHDLRARLRLISTVATFCDKENEGIEGLEPLVNIANKLLDLLQD